VSRKHTYRLRMLGALTIGNRRLVAGAEIELDAGTAAELIRSGRARLVNGDDGGPLFDATAGLRPRARSS
jgi:hypothetical protein